MSVLLCFPGADGEDSLYEPVRHFQTLPGRVSPSLVFSFTHFLASRDDNWPVYSRFPVSFQSSNRPLPGSLGLHGKAKEWASGLKYSSYCFYMQVPYQ